MPIKNIQVKGIRTSIPTGHVLGRTSPGEGGTELLAISDLGNALTGTGTVLAPGAATPLSPIATHTILANPTGSTAQPIATTLPDATAGITWVYGATSITITLANDLAALEGLGSTGIAVRTAADTWAQRTITGTADKITVSDGSGVAGNPTITIAATYAGQTSITTLGTIGTGTWQGTVVGVTYGGTGANLSATGGASNVLQQTSVGAAITVGQLAASNLSNGTTGSGAVVLATSPTIAGGSITALTTFAIRDTSAAFDVTIAATSAPALSAGRTLTLDMSNVAHTLDFGATTNTITFPSAASYTVAGLSVAGTWSATQTSMTLSGATLTGATTLPDSGQLSSAGELALGVSPSSRLGLGGTYTTANSAYFRMGGTWASSVTATQTALLANYTLAPSGASLSAWTGINHAPTLNSTAFTLNGYSGINSSLTLGASFSGAITTANMFIVTDPTVSGGSITTLVGYQANTVTNGDGASSGTITNVLFRGSGITSGSAGGTVNNRTAQFAVPSGGSSSGTTNNRGLYITGNGGTASGGTVNNYAIYDDSTAGVYIAGGVGVGTTTAPSAGVVNANSGLQAAGVVVSPTNSSQSTPSDPTGTTSTTGVMMGLAGAITPKATTGSGNVLIIISGTIKNATAIADGGKVQIRTGTGTAPTNGAALTGTTRGGLVRYVAATTAEEAPFSLNAVATGLTLGTAYWIDVGLAAITGGTAVITDVSISAVEI